MAILCGVGISDRLYRRDELVKRPWLWKAYALLAVAQVGLGIYILLDEGHKFGLWHIGLGSFWALLGFVAYRGSRPREHEDGQPH